MIFKFNIVKLDNIKNASGEKLVQKRHDLLEAICRAINIPFDRSVDELLFDQKNSTQQKEFIALCLLRSLCRNENFIWEWDQRVKVFKLFDELLSEKLYKIVGIKSSEDNHNKLAKLRDIETKILKQHTINADILIVSHEAELMVV